MPEGGNPGKSSLTTDNRIDTDLDKLARIGAFTKKVMLANGIFIRIICRSTDVCSSQLAVFSISDELAIEADWSSDSSRAFAVLLFFMGVFCVFDFHYGTAMWTNAVHVKNIFPD